MRKENKYTVITGASRGLGRALATICAKKKMNLILISLPKENILGFANSLKKEFGIDVMTYETDLTKSGEVEAVLSWINKNFNIDILINNAGTGGSKSFHEVSSEYINNIILLNIRALVLLTHGLLPNLKKQTQAYILNIASLASFGPMPYKTVYPASKAFVYSFSRSLFAELEDTNVFVSVAHPGGMATNDEIARRINQYNRIIKATILSPEKTAQICINQLLKKDALIIPGFMNKLSWIFFKTCPVWLQLIIFKRSISKEVQIQNAQHE